MNKEKFYKFKVKAVVKLKCLLHGPEGSFYSWREVFSCTFDNKADCKYAAEEYIDFINTKLPDSDQPAEWQVAFQRV